MSRHQRSSSASASLEGIVQSFARAFCTVDAARPIFTSRSGREYQPGLGPHGEDAAMRLIVDELLRTEAFGGAKVGQFAPYPHAPRQKADLWIAPCSGASIADTPRGGEVHWTFELQWVIEVKMARFFGDNGKPDDTSIKDILSPYPQDRSALADCTKLAESGFDCRKAVIIYGFDYPARPLDPIIEAFEVLARRSVELGRRSTAPLPDLVHPVHLVGRVFGWDIGGPLTTLFPSDPP